MTREQKLQAITKAIANYLTNSDLEAIELDIARGKTLANHTQELHEMLMKLYRITHAVTCTCEHKDWEAEANAFLEEYITQTQE